MTFKATCLLLILSSFMIISEARTATYWDSVNSIVGGYNLYDILGVSEDASFKDIKKAFRTASKEFHPDHNPSSEAKEMMIKINLANLVLSDEMSREEYNHLLKYGVPVQDRYYGRYTHAAGIPDHNPWIVFPTLYAVATGIHWMMKWNHHKIVMKYVRKSEDYKRKRREIIAASGVDPKILKAQRKELKSKGLDPDDVEDDPYAPPIHIYGAEKPTWKDILPIAMIVGVFNLLKKPFEKPVPPMEQLRRHMELRDQREYTTQDAEAEMKRMEESRNRILNSNKYKKAVKYFKQQDMISKKKNCCSGFFGRS